jgi:3-deoxy-manno-octulosonate cytidylyltransferase (CMP-KDO synthetase)
MTLRTAIIIPARYASVRLPGKPLVSIAGHTMLERVVALAKTASRGLARGSVIVATDDERIAKHCKEIDVAHVMTPPECPSGTDRVAEAVKSVKEKPDFVLNLQGDAPLTPPDFLRAMIDSFIASPCDMITPVTRMTWDELDRLRENKKVTPLSGTCVAIEERSGNALWFSKNIIPALRKEQQLRAESKISPIYRHIGVYGYARAMLERYASLPEGRYEKLEGLEQLRALENGYKIRCVEVEYKDLPNMSGIDSPEDVARAEELIKKHGDPFIQS